MKIKLKCIKRINRACKYFPCHATLEDCTFCYCPLYPCLNENRGKYIYTKSAQQRIWSCQSCSWIHSRQVTDHIFKLIRQSPPPTENIKRINCSQDAGIIILAHGSRVKETKKALQGIIAIVKHALGEVKVAPAFLQLCNPGLPAAVKTLVQQGCTRLVIAPYFLFNGGHVTRDIPRIIKALQREFPQVEFIYAKNVSDDAQMISTIVIERIREALKPW